MDEEEEVECRHRLECREKNFNHFDCPVCVDKDNSSLLDSGSEVYLLTSTHEL